MTQPLSSFQHRGATRRGFMAASSAAGIAASLAVSRSAHAAGSDLIKIGLIGCGNRGTGAAVNALEVSQNVKLWAMADAFSDRLDYSLDLLASGKGAGRGQTIAKAPGRIDVPEERKFVGLQAYKQAIDASDVVILTGPPGFRPDHFEYAVERGKHVFMEKPVATDAPGIRRILAASKIAEQKGLKVGVGLQRHHEPIYIETIQRLRDGAIGDLKMLRCYWNGGTIKQPPPTRVGLTELEYQVRNWYFFAWLSGDHIVEQHVHNLDVCNWIVGDHPISALGAGGRQMRTGKDYGDIFDHHFVEFTYPNGLKMFSMCRQMPGCEPLIGEFAVGSLGDAEVSKGILRGPNAWRFPTPPKGTKSLSPYQIEHDDLFRAIIDNRPYNEVQGGATATMTAILGRMATYTGRTVSWEEGFASERVLGPEKIVDWDTLPKTLPDSSLLYKLPQPGLLTEV